eukprot:scaffold212_cov108-Skeletonema_dohrnii-CCMP3373.AAC.15
MGHYKQSMTPCTALDTIRCSSVARGHPNWTSSGHLRRCSTAGKQIKSLSSGKYPSILSLPTIMGHWKQSMTLCKVLDTIRCSSVAHGHPNWTSSGHLSMTL